MHDRHAVAPQPIWMFEDRRIRTYDKARDCIVSGRYSIDHIAAMATAMPASRIIQKQTSGATPITQRTRATKKSTAASTMFVPWIFYS